MDIITLQNGTIYADLVKAVGSRKKKAIIAPRRSCVHISGTYWDGGSRSDWFLVKLATKEVRPLAHQNPPQFGGPKEDPIQPLEPGWALIEAGVFCGKPSTPTIYLHPEEKV